MKRKMLLVGTLLCASTMLLAGCDHSWSMFGRKSSSKETPAPAPSQEEESSSSEEREPETWAQVNEETFVQQINISVGLECDYTQCIVNGVVGGDDPYFINNVLFTKNSRGKYVTENDSEAAAYASNFVNMTIDEFDYNHLGDGGKYIEPELFVSTWGKMKVICHDGGFVTTVIFEEHGRLAFIGGGGETNPTAMADITFMWS